MNDMSNFRRYYIPNSIIFITCVTRDRSPFLESNEDVNLFFYTLARVNDIYQFEILAHVVLPDHFHWLLKVADPHRNFSKIIHSIKRNFTLNYKKLHEIESPLSIWQERFWDHIIRDELDLERHFDYVHWNPVNHGYSQKPEDWPYSTYRKWVNYGYYELGWGWSEEPESISMMEME